ncbi:hypothetical protein K0M31_017985, partial [Melipona bicolor]
MAVTWIARTPWPWSVDPTGLGHTPTRCPLLRTCGPDGRVHAISEKECTERVTGPRGETTVPFFRRRPFRSAVAVKGEDTLPSTPVSGSEAAASHPSSSIFRNGT